MKYVYLKFDLNITHLLEVGKVVLVGSTGIKYTNTALLVPGYGWIPCSKALSKNFTTDPKQLVLIISEEDDTDKPVTSDIWISRTGLLRRIGSEVLSEKNKAKNTKNKDVALSTPKVKAFNRMSARALVISENAVLQFLDSPKKDKNGNFVQEISFVCGTKQGYVSPAAKSIIKTGTIDDFQYAEVSLDGKAPMPCILKTKRTQ